MKRLFAVVAWTHGCETIINRVQCKKPQVITHGHARRKEERKNEKLNLSNYIVPGKY